MKKLSTKLVFLFAVIGILSTACNETKKPKDSDKTDSIAQETRTQKDCDEVHWSHHEGEDGPENWGNLCAGFSACAGSAQSPVDIVTDKATKDSDLPKLDFNYGYSPIEIINNGHTVQFNIESGSSLATGEKSYELLQFHYHALSEHTIDGEHSALEVHFVHILSDTELAVIGIMIEEGEESPLFASYLDNFPKKGESFTAENDSINLINLLPDDKSYYHYKGSLTTPPCSETVNWYLLKTPLTASAEQIEQFSAILDNNYRPVQALNGRIVKSNK